MRESSIAVFGGDYCHGQEVISALAQRTGYKVVEDRDLISGAVELSGLPESVICRAFSSKSSVFDKFTHEKQRSLAYLRLALANILNDSGLLIAGNSTHLISKDLSHVLRVCLVADTQYRVTQAMQREGLPQSQAFQRIVAIDQEKSWWTKTLLDCEDPWDASLYDVLLPMSQKTVEEAVTIILELNDHPAVQPAEAARKALVDNQLAAQATVTLVRAGHDGLVAVKDGDLTVHINMKVLMFNRLQEELRTLLNPLPGVKSVKIEIDPSARLADTYRKYDFATPSKVLLVDDEKEFVQTLSERLIFRNVGTAVAYDGQSALEMVVDDDPDVLVLDLKMPGMGGIDVLRRVKKIRPFIEVIILTGHGSEDDRKTCMDLGAFDYLHKPVDINLLSCKLKEAHERAKNRKSTS